MNALPGLSPGIDRWVGQRGPVAHIPCSWACSGAWRHRLLSYFQQHQSIILQPAQLSTRCSDVIVLFQVRNNAYSKMHDLLEPVSLFATCTSPNTKGNTSASMRKILISRGSSLRILLIPISTWSQRWTTIDTWYSQVRAGSSMTPSTFAFVTPAKVWSLKRIVKSWVFLLRVLNSRSSVFEGFIFRLFWVNQVRAVSKVLSTLALRGAKFLGSSESINWVSSAYITTLPSVMWDVKSLVKMRSTGPSTEPWTTPCVAGVDRDEQPRTVWERFANQSSNQCPLIPYHPSFFKGMSCCTLSKAFEVSAVTSVATRPSSIWRVTLLTVSSIAISVEWPCQNPYWFWHNIWLSKRNASSWVQAMRSHSFSNTDNIDIGL